MRICFVTHSGNKGAGGGGSTDSMLELIKDLKKKRVDCYVIIPSSGSLIGELEKFGIPHSVFPYKWWAQGFHFARIASIAVLTGFLGFLYDLLISILVAIQARSWQADIIYTNSSVIPVGALAARILGKPHVWHIREFGKEDNRIRYGIGFSATARLVDLSSKVVIIISHALARKYTPYIPKNKLNVIYNAVRINYNQHVKILNAKPKKVHQLVIVGEVREGKGQIDAVCAVAYLIKQNIPVKLTIVGGVDPRYYKTLKKVIVEENISPYIHFTGWTDNPFFYVTRSDIALVCSRSEAFGRIVIEAMHLAKPIIGSRSGAIPELIQESFNGMLYTPGDYKDLATNIKYLIDHPELAKSMGKNGYKWAQKKFTMEKYTENMFKIFKEIIT